jgi:hypothetical protein
MATGATARAVRDGVLLNAGHFLTSSEAAIYCSEVPNEHWFSTQREALGLESYVYTFMRIAGCEKIIQWGFDETSIDGHETLNQWAMLMDGNESGETFGAPTTVVTLECAALLPGSEAPEVVHHIEEVWMRGKLAVDYLREQLGPELRDVLCPLRNGGVSLHKIYGIMHDTCNCANKVALLAPYPNPYTKHGPIPHPKPDLNPNPDPTTNPKPKVAQLMSELRNRKCVEHFGETVWSQGDKKMQACFDFLCGNHTRNLPVVRFNKAYNRWLYLQLGEQMRVAKQAAGMYEPIPSFCLIVFDTTVPVST